MRIRTIKPEFFKHDELATVSALARLAFIGLWCIADREGRMEDRPRRIKAEILPYDECEIEPLLGELSAKKFIIRYAVDGVGYIKIPSFVEHQRITGKEAETESKFPDVPENHELQVTLNQQPIVSESQGKQSGNNGEAPETTGKEGKGREGSGKERKGAPAAQNSFSNTVMPDLPTWLARVTPADEWEIEWWTKTWQREAGAGWRMKGGRPIVDWCLRQDSFLGYFQSAKDERAAKSAPPDEAAFLAERQRDEDRRRAVEAEQTSELLAGLREGRL